MKVKVNGVWRDSRPQARIAGNWKECTEGFIRTGGNWRKFLDRPGPKIDTYILNKVRLGGGTGYIRGQGGSITPNEFNGRGIYTLNLGSSFPEFDHYLTLGLMGNLPRSFFSRMVIEDIGTVTPAGASQFSYVPSENFTRWVWLWRSDPFLFGEYYDVQANPTAIVEIYP